LGKALGLVKIRKKINTKTQKENKKNKSKIKRNKKFAFICAMNNTDWYKI
jgi:hypothetical protein